MQLSIVVNSPRFIPHCSTYIVHMLPWRKSMGRLGLCRNSGLGSEGRHKANVSSEFLLDTMTGSQPGLEKRKPSIEDGRPKPREVCNHGLGEVYATTMVKTGWSDAAEI